jgi:ATP-binding cassette subfamily B protein
MSKIALGGRGLFSVTRKAFVFAWKTRKGLLLLLIVLNAIIGGLIYLQFTSFSAIVDEIVRLKSIGSTALSPILIKQSIILGSSFLVPSILESINNYYRSIFREEQMTEMALHRMARQGNLDIATVESSWYQNLLQQANEWGTNSIANLQTFIFNATRSIVGIFVSIGILYAIDYRLVILAVAAAIPTYFYYRRYSMELFRVRHFSTEDKRLINNRSNHFANTERVIDVILLKLQSWLLTDVGGVMRSFDRKLAAAAKKKATGEGTVSVWYVLCFFVSIYLISTRALEGTLAIGALLLAFNSYRSFYQTTNTFFELFSFTEESARYASKWFELFELEPLIQNSPDAKKLTIVEPPKIEFKNVSFSYTNDTDAREVLSNINLTINGGEKVAIVGMNGAGKTTLIKLLCRVYDPKEGEILINGVNLKDIDIHDWHDALGILFQDYPIYNLTVREGIAVGRKSEPIDEKKVLQAAEFAGAHEFIEELPKKYDQLIWKSYKDGVDLSKGQHQRLAVARMFYRNAPITILDEPTASVDAITEEKIFNSLEEHMEGKTVVLITHKFSTVKNADRIIVLEHGKIMETGKHDELIKAAGRYSELYNIQAKRYREEESDLSVA